MRGHSSLVYCACFSPDSTLIASVSKDKTLRIWNAETHEVCHALQINCEARACMFSPDGDRLGPAQSFFFFASLSAFSSWVLFSSSFVPVVFSVHTGTPPSLFWTLRQGPFDTN
jgi:WD40 repeat protein